MMHNRDLHPPSENAETRRPEGPSLISKKKGISGFKVGWTDDVSSATDAPPVLHLWVRLEFEIVSHGRTE